MIEWLPLATTEGPERLSLRLFAILGWSFGRVGWEGSQGEVMYL